MKIKTGNIGTFKTGMFSSFKFLYSGMPTPQTFAICPIMQRDTINGESCSAPIVYYPIESEVIWIVEYKFKVKEINANFIKLDLIKN